MGLSITNALVAGHWKAQFSRRLYPCFLEEQIVDLVRLYDIDINLMFWTDGWHVCIEKTKTDESYDGTYMYIDHCCTPGTDSLDNSENGGGRHSSHVNIRVHDGCCNRSTH